MPARGPPPAHWAALDDPHRVASLRAAGAREQAAALAVRLPAVGMFGLFLEQEGRADQFRFGREPDGTPAALWDWETWTITGPSAAEEQKNASAASAGCPLGDRPPDTRERRPAVCTTCENTGPM